jgi:hypothetical protein
MVLQLVVIALLLLLRLRRDLAMGGEVIFMPPHPVRFVWRVTNEIYRGRTTAQSWEKTCLNTRGAG